MIPPYVARVLTGIAELSVRVNEMDRELEACAAADPTCQLLMTAPGVGPTTAIRFVAAVDDVTRFPSAHRVEAYLGLTPGERSSSERKRRTGITKAGPSKLRWILVQAAWSARRYYKDHPLVMWALEVEKRRGKNVAVMALARRLAGILYAMWRDGRPYDKDHRHLVTHGASAAA